MHVQIQVHAFVPSFSYKRRSHTRQTSSVLQNNVDGEEEWRDFRARLVQNGLPSLDGNGREAEAGGDSHQSESASQEDALNDNGKRKNSGSKSRERRRYAYESTPLVEVGTILISVPTTDLCQALEQQYWHRAVVLITEVAKDTKIGELETVPDEQLAQGANRGRWSYRGVLLNRFTDLEIDLDGAGASEIRPDIDSGIHTELESEIETGEPQKHKRYRSRLNVQRGGDLLGLNMKTTMSSFSGHQLTNFICLHQHLDTCSNTNTDLDSCIRSVSTKLVGELSFMSLNDAQSLCKNEKFSSKYGPNDLFAFGGFCSWRPGQLELEMGEGREEWLALSVDDSSIIEELKHQSEEAKIVKKFSAKTILGRGPNQNISRGLLDTGTNMWCNFLAMIDVSESRATERLPSRQLEFYDRMLEVWAEDNLLIERDDNNGIDKNNGHDEVANTATATATTVNSDSTDSIGPGTLLRARLRVSNDMLLYENEFIRSLVLVIEETPDASIGIMLNHPLAAAVECVEGKDPLPLRYGGPIDVPTWKDGTYDLEDFDGEEDDESDEDDEMYEGFLDYQSGARDDLVFGDDNTEYNDDENDEDDDDSPFLWIHRDIALGSRADGGGGVQLGTSDVWMIKENDALRSLQSGFLRLEDVMVFSGVCIWEKGDDLGGLCGGGLREQVDALKSLEVIRACDENIDQRDHDAIESVWDILSKHQNVLVKESFESNVAATIDAWESCTHDEVDTKRSAAKERNHLERIGLSDAALRAWVGVNLLLDPLGTLIEL